jgi:O-antigen ligase
MNSKRVLSKNDSQNIVPLRTILFICSVISLYFNSNLADPFNSAKQIVLIISSAWLVGSLLLNNHISIVNLKKNKFILLVALFLISGFISFLMTDFKFTGLFGESQRKLGLITYLCLAVIMVFASRHVNYGGIKQFYFYSQLTLFLFLIYGTIQFTGNDFIEWQNNYNVIIGTLGNPNYASAFMAMMACICFSVIFLKTVNIYSKLFSLVLLLWSVFLIYQSDSKQGLVSISLGISIILMIQLFRFNKRIGIVFAFISSTLGLFAILGMLQIGPLEYFLYKDSVTLRGYYWSTGINMFQQNPLFGVGLDRYGANFNQFKDQDFVVNRNFDLISTNAHNIPIHIFASGGLFFGLSYLLIILFILIRAVRGLRKTLANDMVFLSGVFGAWMAYQSQAVVSIENIGMAVWGWFFGGSIIGLTSLHNKTQSSNNFSKTALQPIVSMLFVLISLVPVTNLLRSEQQTIRAQVLFNSNNAANIPEIRKISQSLIASNFTDPYYKLAAANYLLTIGDTSEGLNALNNLVEKDPRNTQALSSLANYSESKGDYFNAINFREIISKVDPYNGKNYLKLGLYFKQIKDYENMERMLEKINGIAPNSEVGIIASKELRE